MWNVLMKNPKNELVCEVLEDFVSKEMSRREQINITIFLLLLLLLFLLFLLLLLLLLLLFFLFFIFFLVNVLKIFYHHSKTSLSFAFAFFHLPVSILNC